MTSTSVRADNSADNSANIATAERFLQLVSDHDLEGIIALTAPDWTMHGGPPGLPRGPEGVKRLFATFGPIEQQWTVDDVVAHGDRVVLRGTNVCTQDAFLGVPGRGVRQVFTATFVLRIVDGLVAEIWRNADDLGRVLQLGARIVPGGSQGAIEARWAGRGPVERVVDQLVAILESGDIATLERIYHPDLQFVTHPGAVLDRAGALATFRQLRPVLQQVRVDVRDRQLTDTGFVSQHVLSATLADGTRLTVPVCMVVGLRDELIVRVDVYFDPADLAPLTALAVPQETPDNRATSSVRDRTPSLR